MDKLQQVKAKLEEMKAKYNQERDEEDFPNHSDGNGMYWSGVFACLKEISFFVDHLEVKEVDLEKELIEWHKEHFKKDGTFIGMSGFYLTNNSQMDIAKHFFELGLKASQKGEKV